MDKAPLVGQTFTTNASEVYTYIVRFTSGNTVLEANFFSRTAESNGRLDFVALKDHYEDVVVNAVNSV